MVREAWEESWAEQLVMAFKFVTGTSPVVVTVERPVSETDTGVLLEGECDRVPMVCPMAVVFPDSWI